ncbi:MAG: amino acid synthesis family protein [Deltaproteobacteria bacterium]|jgi:hypothetical protein|nr:amino acid synthesis family protein [Deltaproteobacteria bacterium]MBT4265299.1 amino acid synthesis family protein [Deltaproteobacteria bacterium]MBT4637871.1 amino acid synthesis family protein [Deltaproteobacteria bacterium]MBT6615109.1 amino acid synthesis family protein [Deltaproteobacteria bacterium]
MDVRKYVDIVEEIQMDNGKKISPAVKKAAAVAVIKNPFANTYQENLESLIDMGDTLGEELSRRAMNALNIGPDQVESFGKGVLVGMGGELEHAAALMHPKLGHAVRRVVGGGKTMMPSAKKMGVPGTELDVPVHCRDAALVRSHFDAMAVRVQDAPRDNEILVIVILTAGGGRPLSRVGGLKKEEISVRDGLR